MKLFGIFSKKEPVEKLKQIDVSTPGIAELDINSPTWIYFKKKMETELASLRERNDSLNLDQRKTDEIRGRIAQLKDLLNEPGNRLQTNRHYAGEDEQWNN